MNFRQFRAFANLQHRVADLLDCTNDFDPKFEIAANKYGDDAVLTLSGDMVEITAGMTTILATNEPSLYVSMEIQRTAVPDVRTLERIAAEFEAATTFYLQLDSWIEFCNDNPSVRVEDMTPDETYERGPLVMMDDGVMTLDDFLEYGDE